MYTPEQNGSSYFLCNILALTFSRARAEPDGTRAETTFRLSPKRTSPFKSTGEKVQSTVGSRGVRISVSDAGYTTFRGRMRVLATHSIRQLPLHFPSRASPCATTFRTQYTTTCRTYLLCPFSGFLVTTCCFYRFPSCSETNQNQFQDVHKGMQNIFEFRALHSPWLC